jgi:formamidopyrimidine-DNA glycosylase
MRGFFTYTRQIIVEIMIELPEAIVLSREIDELLKGKRIRRVVAAQSPHKFAWYYEDPANYHELLVNKTIDKAISRGGMVEISINGAIILFSEGIRLRYFIEGDDIPAKHQLLIEFSDNSTLLASVQMYGGLCAFPDGAYDNKYYNAAKDKPSPLSDDFDWEYFEGIINEGGPKLSVKALLATEQRIPGLGNGVLQDILFNARVHPAKKMATFTGDEVKGLFSAVKETLADMAEKGGRDTESDLLGHPGGYKSILSKNTVNTPCPTCGTAIKKKAYMGGSVYFCESCQSV